MRHTEASIAARKKATAGSIAAREADPGEWHYRHALGMLELRHRLESRRVLARNAERRRHRS